MKRYRMVLGIAVFAFAAFLMGQAAPRGCVSPEQIYPQGQGSGLDADMIDGKHASEIGASGGTVTPDKIVPQGQESGLDADMIDGKHAHQIQDADDHVSSADDADTVDGMHADELIGTTSWTDGEGTVSTNSNVGIGTDVPEALLDVEGDMSGGGMLLASESSINDRVAMGTRFQTLATVPIYISRGTQSLRGKIRGRTGGGGYANVRFKIGAYTSTTGTMTSGQNENSEELTMIIPLTGWQTLEVQARPIVLGHLFIIEGYTLYVQD
jgi:hypothetical protein